MAKIHCQKNKSHSVMQKAKESMNNLRNDVGSTNSIEDINNAVEHKKRLI